MFNFQREIKCNTKTASALKAIEFVLNNAYLECMYVYVYEYTKMNKI